MLWVHPVLFIDHEYRLKANEVIKLRLILQHTTTYQIMASCARMKVNTIDTVSNYKLLGMNDCLKITPLNTVFHLESKAVSVNIQ